MKRNATTASARMARMAVPMPTLVLIGSGAATDVELVIGAVVGVVDAFEVEVGELLVLVEAVLGHSEVLKYFRAAR
jgi:hypothetical protein